jgi:hypothetical protein
MNADKLATPFAGQADYLVCDEPASLTPAEHLRDLFLFFNNFPTEIGKAKVINQVNSIICWEIENRLEL